MPLVGALVVIGVLVGVVFWAFGRDPGPSPAEVAVAYEGGWDRLDFSLLYDLSGDELRDGMRRAEFVEAKRAAYGTAPVRAVSQTVDVVSTVHAASTALVVTRVATSDGEVRDDVVLERRGGRWVVVGYSLRRDEVPPSRP